ncbi:MAG: hypothetical protein IJR55_05965 [Clostridia bacterium]|nr:hypothetical protein [Clostridia bacterium]
MTIFLQISAICCGLYGVYMIICAVRSIWGERTLIEHDCILTDREIVIFAEANTLEYLLRAAEAERNLTSKRIEVNIRASDADYSESLFIAKAFCKKHSNTEINII